MEVLFSCAVALPRGALCQLSVKAGGAGGFYNFDARHTEGMAGAFLGAARGRMVKRASWQGGPVSAARHGTVRSGKISVNFLRQRQDRAG